MKLLICADCKWHISNPASTETTNIDKCRASEVLNLVTGRPLYKFADTMRSPNGACGIDARLFELNVGEQDQGGGELEDPFHTH
jgi:hypothetical protein